MTDTPEAKKLDPETLRWRCDPGLLKFDTTAEVDTDVGIVGQPTAVDALRFGIECRARGQNVYIRGLSGTGRMTMVRRVLEELRPQAPVRQDRCYVHNFSHPDRPRLISLPAGQARPFCRRMRTVARCIAEDLPKALASESVKAERDAIQDALAERVREITAPLEEDLKRAGLALVSVPAGPVAQTAIFPLVEGKPVALEQFEQLAAKGEVPASRLRQVKRDYPQFRKRLHALTSEVSAVYQSGVERTQAVNERTARALLSSPTDAIARDFPGDDVATFLREVLDDVVETRLRAAEEPPDPAVRYGVNVLVCNEPGNGAPIVEEGSPSLVNLLGSVEPEWSLQGQPHMDYRGVRAGALLRADGGYLILDLKDMQTEAGAWRALMRTLRTGRLEIVPTDLGLFRPAHVLKPEPIEVAVRVILLGDAMTYHQLNALDPDFSEMFKVLADIDHEIDRDAASVAQYARVLAGVVRAEGLLHFDRAAVAALVEHGARIAARAGKLTARFGRLADIAREASFLARRQPAPLVDAGHVREAVRRSKRRASLPSRKFQELVNRGTIQLEISGAVVGQINGLAVMVSGPLTYGFPARITATIGAGRAGLINIEGRAAMSGAIHTKGFHILGGLLRYLLRTDHPLAFSASIAFEQSYGGIDGDSASGAEVCCLLSALTGVPIRQGLAMTGAIDQHGHVQAIGGVNEKIEGFYDACEYFGLDGEQGVIIPAANAGDLMLREDVVAACERGAFRVHAVASVGQALELLTGVAAGVPVDGVYPEGTLLRMAVERAGEFWRKTLASPAQLVSVEGAEAQPEGTPPRGP